ncbi:RidA family protein [Kitasatospora sp. NA04385]|uniref:RidA family protein n=1 Tax=Kitasatospora sp. NA04385 TaxID=2742135 RepID=UPI001591D5B3|nr:RidA family protein [Kitasatospora sp. NA04385]QKW22855.1 RidA family protein [Kitasatospora sp. NA04385]
MRETVRIPTPYSYSAAVAAGEYVFLGLHRGFGPTVAAQAESALDGVAETLAELGTGLDGLVKAQVWLRHITDLPAVEAAFADRFAPGAYPARMTASTEFADPDCLLMIEGVAHRGQG